MSSFNKNKWSEVKKIRDELNTMEKHPDNPCMILEESWAEIIRQYELRKKDYSVYFEQEELSRESICGMKSNPLETFQFLLSMGVYPPPELMLWLWSCFSTYFQSAGKIEMEEIFFGHKQNAGNYAARNRRDQLYSMFEQVMEAGVTEAGETFTQTKGVRLLYEWMDDCLPDVSKPEDPESFLRGYRRWKERQDSIAN